MPSGAPRSSRDFTGDPPCLWVLAGTNGAGKSSIGGAMLRQSGGSYFNPDEAARRILEEEPGLSQTQANAAAWALGLRQLDTAIHLGRDYFFETTLGGRTIAARLRQAIQGGHDVRMWYVGLDDPELHLARVAARVRSGGHDIPEKAIRQRFDASRRNLIELLPQLRELVVYDNSTPADPRRGEAPRPRLVLRWCDGALIGPPDLRRTPEWAKPIVAQALKHVTH